MSIRSKLVEQILQVKWDAWDVQRKEMLAAREYDTKVCYGFNPKWTDSECLARFHALQEHDKYVEKETSAYSLVRADVEKTQAKLNTLTLKELRKLASEVL